MRGLSTNALFSEDSLIVTISYIPFIVKTSGAFKFRGACNAVLSLDAEQAAKGVVTHSRFCKSLFPYYERLVLYF